VKENEWAIASTIFALGAIMLSLGGAVSLARWWWRRRRPAVESRTRTYAEWPLLLLGFRANMDASLYILHAPEEIYWIARIVGPCVVVASVVLFVRLLIVLAGRAIRLVRPKINTELPSGPSWGRERALKGDQH